MAYGFNEDKSKADFPIIAGNLAAAVDVSGYQAGRTGTNWFDVPNDGYIHVAGTTSTAGGYHVFIAGASDSAAVINMELTNSNDLIFVHAGMKVAFSGTALTYARYFALS